MRKFDQMCELRTPDSVRIWTFWSISRIWEWREWRESDVRVTKFPGVSLRVTRVTDLYYKRLEIIYLSSVCKSVTRVTLKDTPDYFVTLTSLSRHSCHSQMREMLQNGQIRTDPGVRSSHIWANWRISRISPIFAKSWNPVFQDLAKILDRFSALLLKFWSELSFSPS